MSVYNINNINNNILNRKIYKYKKLFLLMFEIY